MNLQQPRWRKMRLPRRIQGLWQRISLLRHGQNQPDRSVANRSAAISLFWVLTVPFVVQVVGAVGLVGYWSYRSGQTSVENLANRLLDAVDHRVRDHVDSLLSKQQHTLAANGRAIQGGKLPLDNSTPWRDYLWQQMATDPSLVATMFANDRGLLVGYVRSVNLELRQQIEQLTGKSYPVGTQFLAEASPNLPNQRLYSRVNDQGQPLEAAYQITDDVRQTAWFQRAQSSRQPTWSPVYTHRVIPMLGIDALLPIYDGNRNFRGVLSRTVLLSGLNTFLNQLQISPRGQAFIVDRSGNLVATSTLELPYIQQPNQPYPTRLSLAQSRNSETRAIAQQLQQKNPHWQAIQTEQRWRLAFQNGTLFTKVTPYQDAYGLHWLVVTAVPEADFIGEIEANHRQNLWFCLLALAGSLGTGTWTAKRLSRSLRNLTEATRAIAAGQHANPLPKTRVAEVNRLTQAFQQMVGALQAADQLRHTYARDLEQQVAQKTAALTEAQRIAQVGSWEFDVATGTSTWSAEQFRILGLEPDGQEPGHPDLFDLLPEADRPRFVATVTEAIEQGIPYTIEHGIQRRDGLTIYLISRGEPIFDQQGRVVKLVGTITNITDQKRMELALRQSELKFATIFQAGPEAAWIAQINDGYCLNINDNFTRILGYSHVEMVGKSCTEMQLWKDPNDLTEFRKVLKEQGWIREFETEFRTKSGEIKTVLLSATISYLEGQDCLIGILSDISDRKQVERELHQAKEAAEVANRAKSTFLAKMSHELRTPLNIILGFTNILQREAVLSPTQRDDLQRIYRSGEHLLKLINEILDLSKIEAGKLTLAPQVINLRELMQSVADLFLLQAQHKGLQLDLQLAELLPTHALVDGRKLEQVLINLISNALKFTQTGFIRVRLRSHNSSPNQLPPVPETSPPNIPDFEAVSSEITPIPNSVAANGASTERSPSTPTQTTLLFEVQDSGIGIAPEHLETIFDDFVQATDHQDAHSGTGLGLAISRQLVELMGGEITAESQLGQGSLFRFYLPVLVTHQAMSQTNTPIPQIVGLASDRTDYRILVVDDQTENRQLLVRLLSCLGLQIHEASNGLEAIAQWQDWQPHLIWMDLRMPGLDGYATTRKIRTLEQRRWESQHQAPFSLTTIIAITAQGSADDPSLAIAAGCNDYMSKPFALDEPFQMMAKYLPLKYRYAELRTDAPDHSVSSLGAINQSPTVDLSVMPQAWIAALHHAALTCSDQTITQLLQQIPSPYYDLFQTLTHLTENFAFPEIVQLTQSVLDSRSSGATGDREPSSSSISFLG